MDTPQTNPDVGDGGDAQIEDPPNFSVVVDSSHPTPPPSSFDESLVSPLINNIENHPPPSSSLAHHDDVMSSVQSHLGEHQDPLSVDGVSSPPSSFVPGPLREEPTLKEKLVDRERQRRKEAERARLKRQFALNNGGEGGGAVYDGAASTTGAVRENGSIAGTVGEGSTHAEMEDSLLMMMSPPLHSHSHHLHQATEQSPQLGYTMERFLQERDASATQTQSTTNATNRATDLSEVAAATVAMESTTNDVLIGNVIRDDTIEGDPITGAPDKGVVMERFLNDPVVVDAPASTISEVAQEEDASTATEEDVHRSVSFEVEVGPPHPSNSNDHGTTLEDHIHHHLSVDDSNASVLVEVSPEDADPSEFAPSSLGIDDDHDRGRSVSAASLESVGPSMDQRSTLSTNRDNNHDEDSDDRPRLLRLTEAEIQEMAAIEEASIGNAPPSDRDAESLVGELVGEFGGAGIGDVGATGIAYSQGTPTTAMESGSMLSGNQMSTQRSSVLPGNNNHHDDEPQSQLRNDGELDQNRLNHVPMSEASVSSHLAVSPGTSEVGSAASVTANPPSEIIRRVGPTPRLPLDDDDEMVDGDHSRNGERRGVSPLPPLPILVGSSTDEPGSPSHPNLDLENINMDIRAIADGEQVRLPVVTNALADTLPVTLAAGGNVDRIREEIRATRGPRVEDITNRTMRPGMVSLAHRRPASPPLSPPAGSIRRTSSYPGKVCSSYGGGTPMNNRTVDEFDFDKHDFPMTPGSMMSDSLRDLPGDDLWNSPTTRAKMEVSPIARNIKGAKKVDPLLVVPSMSPSEAFSAGQNSNVTNVTGQKPELHFSLHAEVSSLERIFAEIRAGSNSTVEAKDAEIYDRGSVSTKVMQQRLLPLVFTCAIEIPALRLISEGSDRLCILLGRQHQQMLIGFLPLVAAISGHLSSEASFVTKRAISQGHLKASSYWKWLQIEFQVAALSGFGMGTVVGSVAFFSACGSPNENALFALTTAVVQMISSICAGCTGSTAPIFLRYILRQRARHLDGAFERAAQDIIAVFFTTMISYYLLAILVNPTSDNACNPA